MRRDGFRVKACAAHETHNRADAGPVGMHRNIAVICHLNLSFLFF